MFDDLVVQWRSYGSENMVFMMAMISISTASLFGKKFLLKI